MSAATVAVAPRRAAYTATGTLLRAALRRDRRRLLIWVLSLAAITVYATVGLRVVYRTAADRQARAAVIRTPAGIVFSGPGYGTEHYTLGAMIANELSLSVMIAIGIMSILLVVRHTRAEEENAQRQRGGVCWRKHRVRHRTRHVFGCKVAKGDRRGHRRKLSGIVPLPCTGRWIHAAPKSADLRRSAV